MTITRALAEKKLLGKRIQQHFQKFKPMAIVIGQDVPTGFKSIQEFENEARAGHDRLKDELSRYDRIVQAIADSNAKTSVVIAGGTYTIASALARKKYWEGAGTEYLQGLHTFFTQIERTFETVQEGEKKKADSEFAAFIGKDKSVSGEDGKAMEAVIANRHKAVLLDPVDMRKIIENIDRQREDFLMNVDIALTESNSVTEIEI